jgi:hypothetical protein
MITWQKIIGVEEIEGEPIAPTSTYTGAGVSGSFAIDWLAGASEGEEGTSGDVDFSEFGFESDETGFGGTWTYGRNQTISFTGGSGTTYFDALVIADNEEGGGSPTTLFEGTLTFTEENAGWSDQPVTLASYETLNSQRSGATTASASYQDTYTTTTSASNSQIVTTTSTRDSTYTTTGSTVVSFPTWQSITYETTYHTGETTAAAYKTYNDAVPAQLVGTTVSTISETIERLALFEREGRASEETFTFTSNIINSPAAQSYPRPQLAAFGPAVVNDPLGQAGITNPRLITNDQIARSIETNSINNYATYPTDTTTHALAATRSVPQGKETAATGNFGESEAAATYVITESSADFDPYAYVSIIVDGGLEISIAGGNVYQNTYAFLTESKAAISAATKITVGVRANEEGEIGSAIEPEGRGVSYYRHTADVWLPAYATFKNSEGNFTISKNSFTRQSGQDRTEDIFGPEGEGVTAWRFLGPTDSQATRATILGGVMSGNAIVNVGAYSTFLDDESGTTTFTEPQFISWADNDGTTAYLPALSVETELVDALSPNIIATARHDFGPVIDDL